MNAGPQDRTRPEHRTPAPGTDPVPARLPGGVTLRDMTAADIPAVHELERRLFPVDAWPLQMFAAELAQAETRRYLVAERGRADRGLRRADVHPSRSRTSRPSPSCRSRKARGSARRCSPNSSGKAGGAAPRTCCWRSGPTTPAPSSSTAASASNRSTSGRRYYRDGVDALIMRLRLGAAEPRSHHAQGSRPPMNSTQHDRPLVLGIESSCDETGVGIVRGTPLLTNTVSSSMDEHVRFGGVIPEIASRAHLDAFVPTLARGPGRGRGDAGRTSTRSPSPPGPGWPAPDGGGLRGQGARRRHRQTALRHQPPRRARRRRAPPDGRRRPGRPSPATPGAAGTPCRRTWAPCWSPAGTPRSCGSGASPDDVELLGSTIDDAAGEAYDKVARLLGLGYPGGPAIDKLARTGNAKAIRFPRGLSQPKYMGTAEEPGPHRYDWSFSGLKTAVARCVEQFEARGEDGPGGGHRRGLPGSRGGCHYRPRRCWPAARTASPSCCWAAAWRPTRGCASSPNSAAAPPGSG